MKDAVEDRIVESLREFVLENYPKARQDILRVDDRLIEKGIIDSLGLLTLIGFLEGTFGIQVLDSDVTEDKFASLRTLSVLVGESLAHQKPELRGESSRVDQSSTTNWEPTRGCE